MYKRISVLVELAAEGVEVNRFNGLFAEEFMRCKNRIVPNLKVFAYYLFRLSGFV